MAKIRDRQTGQVIEVPEEQLGQYGFGTPTPTPTPRTDMSTSEAPYGNPQGPIAGGFFPAAGGILGGIGGGLVGNVPGAALGAAAGTGGGYVVQENLENLLGKQMQQPGEQVASMGKDALSNAIWELIGGYGGKLIGKIPGVNKLGSLFSKIIPEQLYKTSLGSADRVARKELSKQATGEVLEEAGKKTQKEGAKNIWEFMNQEKIKGTGFNILKQSKKALSRELDDSIETALQQTLKASNEAVDLDGALQRATDRVVGNVTKEADAKKAVELIVDKRTLLEEEIKENGWNGVRDWMKKVNPLLKDKTAEGISGLESSIDDAIRAELRKEIEVKVPEASKLLDQEAFWIRIGQMAEKAAEKPVINIRNLLRTLSYAPFTPFPSTMLASVSRRVDPLAQLITQTLFKGVFRGGGQAATRAAVNNASEGNEYTGLENY